MDDEDFLIKLKEICLEYDKYWGTHPESYYEGMSVLNFALEKLSSNEEFNDKMISEYEKEYEKYVEKKWDDFIEEVTKDE